MHSTVGIQPKTAPSATACISHMKNLLTKPHSSKKKNNDRLILMQEQDNLDPLFLFDRSNLRYSLETVHDLILFVLFRQISRCNPKKVSVLGLGVYLLQQYLSYKYTGLIRGITQGEH